MKQSWLNLKYCLDIRQKELRKIMKNLGLAGFRTMILKPVPRKRDTYTTAMVDTAVSWV
jgi:hypothetical protein